MADPPKRSRRSRRRGRRATRRTESHAAAHAEAALEPETAVPDHPLVPKSAPVLITTEPALRELVEHVHGHGSFAYDTEFIGEETYYPRLCVIQIATSEMVALIDPLAGLDVTPVWELIADEAVETIVHAGQQDLEPVLRFLDRPPKSVFDTQLAAGFVNRPYPLGLRQLLEEFLDVRLGKAMTFTRWDARPLSRVHARYAADDVRFLPAVRAELERELEAAGHAAWARQEFEALADPSLYRFDADARLARFVSNHTLRPRRLAILRELIVFRDETARREDVPPRTLLKDEVLLRLAKNPAHAQKDLEAVKGMPWPIAERYGAAMLEAIERARALPADELPVARDDAETPAERVCVDSLWALVCAYCHGRSISPALVANRRKIADHYLLAQQGRRGAAATVSGWRGELIGPLLAAALAGDLTVDLVWRCERLHATLGRETPPECP